MSSRRSFVKMLIWVLPAILPAFLVKPVRDRVPSELDDRTEDAGESEDIIYRNGWFLKSTDRV